MRFHCLATRHVDRTQIELLVAGGASLLRCLRVKGSIEIGGLHVAQWSAHGRDDEAGLGLWGTLVGDHWGRWIDEQTRRLRRRFGQNQSHVN